MAYDLAFQQLLNWSIFTAVDTSYQSVMGAWWIIILYIFTLITIFVCTKSDGLVTVFGIIGSAVLLAYIPTALHPVLYIIIVLSLAMLLFKVFSSREG